jgi:hypothetical protein
MSTKDVPDLRSFPCSLDVERREANGGLLGRPPLSQESFKVERRTWRQCVAPTIRRDVGLDPFGDGSMVDADLRGNIDKGLA